ncbi:MAG: aminotransferase class IV, partial [Desulfohalobiaceae bacterium]|nr:aminotransferase class IV [Desulfohalobiaceae bacterium]
MVPWNSATVPILSHGFSRGSAIFEAFGIHPGTDGVYAYRMDKHLDRLFRSAELLGMKLGSSREAIADGVRQTVKENQIGRGLVKIVAYWSEEAVIKLVLDSKLDVSIFAVPANEELALDQVSPIDVCFSKWRKIRSDMIPAEAKACANYLNGYLARKDAMDRGYDLGILLDSEGYVAEGSIESVFMVKDGSLFTTPTGNILRSVTRLSILEAGPKYGIFVSEQRFSPEMLLEADEIFTSHTGIKVLPVKRLEERELSPVPGPVTKQMMDMMQAVCTMSDPNFKDWFQPMY